MKIGSKYYIGKDVYVSRLKRIKEHLWLLKKGEHYNMYLQNAYNKYGEDSIQYGVLLEEDCSLEKLTQYEKQFIHKYNSYKDGYNLTLGGEGATGFTAPKELIQLRREKIQGDKNPMSKLTNDQFFEIVEHLKLGKTNKEIACLYSLHERYVSLIRHKKRFVHLWSKVPDYVPIKSEQQLITQGKVTKEMFIKIVQMIESGQTNAEIERVFNLSAGTGSRIRNRKLYKQWWIRYIDEETCND